MRARRLVAIAALAAVVALGASPAGAARPDRAAAKKPPVLQILATNDDGVDAPGIDALVEALRKLPRVKVTVVAPATDRTGTGDTVTPGGLPTTESTTASGYPAKVVTGYPADSVNAALDGAAPKKPNVVVSGVNKGQNLGALTDLSGTVGAARTAARRGIPALAVSQGLAADAPDYEAGAAEAVKWVKEHRTVLVKKDVKPFLDNLNVPTCTTGEIRGLIEVPVAPTAENAVSSSDCASTVTDPVDDIQAFNNGYATLSSLPID